MMILLRAIARKHQNPRSFWLARVALALVCWGLWYHDLTGLAVGVGGIVLSLVAFREPAHYTSFSARAVAWQAQLAASWRHVLAIAVAAVPVIWGLWDNNTAWVAIGLLGWLSVVWHFSVGHLMPADARAAFAPPVAPPAEEPPQPSHKELAFP